MAWDRRALADLRVLPDCMPTALTHEDATVLAQVPLEVLSLGHVGSMARVGDSPAGRAAYD